jgi:organic hydroperoxide reductase OsmC/OhrA
VKGTFDKHFKYLKSKVMEKNTIGDLLIENTNTPETKTITKLEKVIYTGKTHTSGGRDGVSRSSDGRLDIKLSHPGTSGVGTNPEQLFAAGWSACFIGAIGIAAAQSKVTLPAGLAVDTEVDLGVAGWRLFPAGPSERGPSRFGN